MMAAIGQYRYVARALYYLHIRYMAASRGSADPRRRRMPPPPATVWGFMFEFLYDPPENDDNVQLSMTSMAALATVRETRRLQAAWAHQQMVLLLGLYRGGHDVIVIRMAPKRRAAPRRRRRRALHGN